MLADPAEVREDDPNNQERFEPLAKDDNKGLPHIGPLELNENDYHFHLRIQCTPTGIEDKGFLVTAKNAT